MSGSATINNPGGAHRQPAQGSQIVDEFIAGAAVASGEEVQLVDGTTGTDVSGTGTGSAVGLAIEDGVAGDVVRVVRSGHTLFFNNTGGTLTGTAGVAKFVGSISDQTQGEAWVAGAM